MAARKRASRPRTAISRKKKASTTRRTAGASKSRRKPPPRASKQSRSPGRAAPLRKARKKAKAKQTAKAHRKSPAPRPRAAARRPAVASKRPAPGRTTAAGRPTARAAAPARKPKSTAETRVSTPAPRKTMASGPPAPPSFSKTQTLRSGPSPSRPTLPPGLSRLRRRLVDVEDTPQLEPGRARLSSSVRTGRDQLKELLGHHTETSPILTAGDIDARWSDAYAVGDEAPGGDNPTPDQDRVDDIGKALGVNYEANEELRGSEKIIERDRHRWELDPASSDDWPHNKD